MQIRSFKISSQAMYVNNRNCDFILPIDDRKRNWKAVREIDRAN